MDKRKSHFKSTLKNLYFIPKSAFKQKVFCISMQRNGTTSVGEFLKDHGYRVARVNDSVKYNWNYLWYIGDFDGIFNSLAFKSFQAYEDSPWWSPDFYKVIYHRFPKAKFILFYRDSDKWFNSMISLKKGETPGNTRRHCKVYRRMGEFYRKFDNDPNFQPTVNESDQLFRLDNMREHYIRVYEEYNREVIEYFQLINSPESLFVCELEDKYKWQKLGDFLGVKVKENYQVHKNRSKDYGNT